jgi:hypothetical protein
MIRYLKRILGMTNADTTNSAEDHSLTCTWSTIKLDNNTYVHTIPEETQEKWERDNIQKELQSWLARKKIKAQL